MLKDSHKRTLKQWKAEQQALGEVEFEWIRQVRAGWRRWRWRDRHGLGDAGRAGDVKGRCAAPFGVAPWFSSTRALCLVVVGFGLGRFCPSAFIAA